MNKIQGYVNRVISAGPGGGSIFVFHKRGGQPIKVVAEYSVQRDAPAVGSCLEIAGGFEDTVYGTQFVASSLTPIQPFGAEIVPLLSSYPIFQFFSWRRCEKLWKKLGSDLYYALDARQSEHLKKLLPPAQIYSLFDAWENYRVLTDLASYLRSHEAPQATAQLLLNIYGSDTLAKISENPYRFSMVWDWGQADQLCQKILRPGAGVIERNVAAVVAVLSEYLHQGATSVSKKQMLTKLQKMLGPQVNPVVALEQAIDAGYCVSSWKDATDFQGSVIAKIESSLLAFFCESQESSFPNEDATKSGGELPEATTNYEVPVANVRQAILKAKACHKSVLKSTTHIAAAIAAHRDDAVIHIGWNEIGDKKSFTDSSLLSNCSYKDLIGGRLHPEHLNPPKLALIHNGERLDVLTLNKIVRAIPRNWSWCLMADFNSLPTEGIGNALDLIQASSLPRLVPEADFIGHRRPSMINLGQVKNWLANSGALTEPLMGVTFIEAKSATEAEQEIYGAYNEATADGTAVVLTASLSSAAAINAVLQRDHLDVRRFEELDCTEIRLRPGVNACIGTPVYIRKSSAKRCILTGEHGIVSSIEAKPVAIHLPSGEAVTRMGEVNLEVAGPYSLYRDEVADLELGFAAPIRYRPYEMVDDVIVYLEKSKGMTEKALWAACTLAKRKCVLIGSMSNVNWGETASTQLDTSNEEKGE